MSASWKLYNAKLLEAAAHKRTGLTEEEAMDLAVSELRAMRTERGTRTRGRCSSAAVERARVEAISMIARTAVAALVAELALQRTGVRPSELGAFAWLSVFDEDDRAAFFDELRDVLSLAEATRDVTSVVTCLREWRTTAQALADPDRRRILTGAGDDAEVGPAQS